nr:hypothetical protein [Tanacetum cinerariifolium]
MSSQKLPAVGYHYNIKPLPQRQIPAFPGDLSLGIGFSGDLSLGNACKGFLPQRQSPAKRTNFCRLATIRQGKCLHPFPFFLLVVYSCWRTIQWKQSDTGQKSANELWDSLKSKYMANDASSKKFLLDNRNLGALRNKKEIYPTVQINLVQAVDDSLIVSKRSMIESENNNALSKSVNETQLQPHQSLITKSTTLEASLNTDVKALDVGLVIT